jgi:Ca2+-dependent lipid-binding protein
VVGGLKVWDLFVCLFVCLVGWLVGWFGFCFCFFFFVFVFTCFYLQIRNSAAAKACMQAAHPWVVRSNFFNRYDMGAKEGPS